MVTLELNLTDADLGDLSTYFGVAREEVQSVLLNYVKQFTASSIVASQQFATAVEQSPDVVSRL